MRGEGEGLKGGGALGITHTTFLRLTISTSEGRERTRHRQRNDGQTMLGEMLTYHENLGRQDKVARRARQMIKE